MNAVSDLRAGRDLLVTPQWVHERLGDRRLRIFDASAPIAPGTTGPPAYQSARAQWTAARIPGAGYLHLIDDLADPDGPFPIALARRQAVWARLGAHGVTNDCTIVIYGGATELSVHRVWWALLASGANDVRVLDGGFPRWLNEARPVESGTPKFAPGRFVASARPEMVATRDHVLGAIGDPRVRLVNALSEAQHRGTGGATYGRPGRIPTSVNVPARSLFDPHAGCFLHEQPLRDRFERAGVLNAERTIVYCGGGIAATTVVLGLATLGYTNVSMYDGSLREWAADPTLPMVSG